MVSPRVAMVALVISAGIFFVGIGLSAASNSAAGSVPTSPAAITR